MRPIDELMRDAENAAAAGIGHLLINPAELRQLKDYELVTGTANPNVALFALPNPMRLPPDFHLLVQEVLP